MNIACYTMCLRDKRTPVDIQLHQLFMWFIIINRILLDKFCIMLFQFNLGIYQHLI